MTCRLHCVDPQSVDLIWPLVGKLIWSAMKRTSISDFDMLVADVLTGRALLWIATNDADVKAAAVTQISKANGRKHCTIIACGGVDHRDWLPLIEQIEDYARRENCAAMRLFGRNGWSRLMPDYKIVGHITERTLT
jgi:hypothetical protein